MTRLSVAEVVLVVLLLSTMVAFIFLFRIMGDELYSSQQSNELLRSDVQALKTSFDRLYTIEFGGLGTNYTGLYSGSQHTIYAVTDRPPHAVSKTLRHEYAHYLQLEVLSPGDYTAWLLVSQANNDTVSGYALTNAAEDFAETFDTVTTLCVDHDALSSVEPGRRDYMNNTVLPLLEDKGVLG